MAWVWVSIGSNIERDRNLHNAVAALRARFGNLRLSPVYETTAVGFVGNPFYNLAAGFETALAPDEVSAALKGIEDSLGRQRTGKRFAPRAIDIDLLTYGDLSLHEPGLEIPRDEILKYAFVLKPLADMAPGGIHPVAGKSYAALWQEFKGDKSLTEVPFDWS
ncbi:MAG: 2-amino-4-hydroxy-6-hydroxymethyldihydropteridine diphosphokinase [Gammaproteobacteria bacterium]|nr:2-amino-4-hydroxy-6-hydroxymethyldihydropteridine diphosphokinase [Gammaproteobacteria bacterium]MBU1655108.1 2-amino-4-hydroxy-6-hydroxymethyldihydropteridine diphosphokinase [Gammaproteobacteria bacterium]MBU1961580.1 2-amino-4-hydroxy-6-hydroxymethyldihydropteridine diphosphokinase [Gammaproteobacteria bacterium]